MYRYPGESSSATTRGGIPDGKKRTRIRLTVQTRYGAIEKDFCQDDLLQKPLNISYVQPSDRKIQLVERLHAMQKQETSYYTPSVNPRPGLDPYKIPPPPLSISSSSSSMSSSSSTSSKKIVDSACRLKICEWCYRIVDFFNLDRETVFYTMSYLERFMLRQHMDRRTYKLAATTALLLAIKVHHPKKVSLNKSVKDLSRGSFDQKDIMKMELIMLPSLSWRLYPPTPANYIFKLMQLNPFCSSGIQEFDTESIQTLAIFFVELSVHDYFFSTQRQSTVALAAILNAMETLGILHYSRRIPSSILDFLDTMFGTLGESCNSMAMTQCRMNLHNLYLKSEEFANKKKAERIGTMADSRLQATPGIHRPRSYTEFKPHGKHRNHGTSRSKNASPKSVSQKNIV